MITDIDDKTYPVVAEWWKAHKWPVLPPESLPPAGFVSWVGERPVMAGFLYLTNSNISIFEWVVANPDSTHEERATAMKELVDRIVEEARNNGSRIIYTFANHPNLIKRYLEHGFQKSDENMTHFIKIVS